MAADLTYPTSRVHLRADGTMAIPSGASLNAESGGTISLASGGALTVADGGQFTVPVVTDTSAANLANFGVSILNSTAIQGVTLDAPSRSGLIKIIVNTVHGASTIDKTVQLANAKLLGGATVVTGTSNIVFDEPGAVTLVSISTALWALASGAQAIGTVTFT